MTDEPSLTHVNAAGQAHMVDVTDKAVTVREAHAAGKVVVAPGTMALVRANGSKKGDVLGVARIAGIMAAKRTDELIPLCHGIPLTGVEVDFALDEEASCVEIHAVARTEGKTGVEMEALTAVTAAALTIYDMCKAVDRGMRIDDVRLTYKAGGRTGTYRAE